jgi:hypothetical protein
MRANYFEGHYYRSPALIQPWVPSMEGLGVVFTEANTATELDELS